MSCSKFCLAGAALLLLGACNNRGGDEQVAADNVSQDMNANTVANNSVADSGPGMAASDFAASVAASDLYEIDSGQLAMQKASSDEVKSFARMLVTDHQKSTADLKSAASQASPPIDVTPALDAEKLAMINALKGAAGADFDRTFIEQQKQAHQKALDLLRQYQTAGDNQALKDFAAEASNVVQSHLEKLNSLTP